MKKRLWVQKSDLCSCSAIKIKGNWVLPAIGYQNMHLEANLIKQSSNLRGNELVMSYTCNIFVISLGKCYALWLWPKEIMFLSVILFYIALYHGYENITNLTYAENTVDICSLLAFCVFKYVCENCSVWLLIITFWPVSFSF